MSTTDGVSVIGDRTYLKAQLSELEAERAYLAAYVTYRKPYWLSLRHPRDGEMQWDLWNYAPLAHYDRAIEETRERLDVEVRTDGGYGDLHSGTTRTTVYYWLDPDTGAALSHIEVGDEQTIPFFPDEESAEEYLERRADAEGDEPFENLSLYKAQTRKVQDATNVLTEQAGIEDFVPDGGLQIENTASDRIWFWYDPTMDHIVQEEVAPYDVRGMFASEDDADRFLNWYAERYGLDDMSHLELYAADVEFQGRGQLQSEAVRTNKEEEPPAQAKLETFRTVEEDG